MALVAGGTILGVLLLAALEGLLALAGVGGDRGDPLAGFSAAQSLFEVQEQGGQDWLVTRPSRLLWFNPQRFPRHKAPGTLRLFTLGGSTTFGRPYDDAVSFSSWLRLLLGEAEPGRRHEVINAGGISYASYRIDVLLGELLAYEPDALVVYTGHNEFLEERTWPELSRGPGLLRRIQGRVSGLRTAALVREVLGHEKEGEHPLAERGLQDDVRARLDVQNGLEAYHRDDRLRDRVVGEFRENLGRIVRRARARGVFVVLVKPASNLKDFSPFKSELSADLDPGSRRRFEALLVEGRSRLQARAPTEAVEPLREAARIDPRHAEVRFLLGRAELALGNTEAARINLEAAREEDVCPLRALEAIAGAVTEVGLETGVPVVDLPALLEKDSRAQGGPGLLGEEQFLDHVHPTVEVHQQLAGELLDVLRREGVVQGHAVAIARREEIYARHLQGLEAAYFARRDVNLGKVLGWAGKVEESRRVLERAVAALPDDPDAHFYLGIQLERSGRLAEAAQHYRRATALAPRHGRAWFNLGKTLQALGDAEGALGALQEALTVHPGDARTLYELARTQGALGRFIEAGRNLAAARRADPSLRGLEDLQAALERSERELEAPLAVARRRLHERPDDPAAHNDLGEALGRAGDMQAAEAAFRRAVGLDPGFVPAQRNLAAVLQLRGDIVGAEATLERVAALHPRDARAQLELGIVRRAGGNLDGARDAFRRAVTLQPDLPRAWVNLGAALAATGDAGGALQAFEEAVRVDPDDADAHFNLAALLREAGREPEARQHLRRARELGASVPEGGPGDPVSENR